MMWIHAGRKVYNNAIAFLNANQGKFTYVSPKGIAKTAGAQAFRSFCKTIDIVPEWCRELGMSHALDNNLMDAYKAWKATAKQPRYWRGTENPLQGLRIAKFRSIRDISQTLQFDPGDYSDGHILARASKGLEKPLYSGQSFCQISYPGSVEVTYRKGRWFVNMPVEVKDEMPERTGKICAIDPGVRTFATAFDGTNFTEVGSKDFARIARLCCHLDRLQSKLSLSKGTDLKRYRYQLRRAMARIREKVKDLRSEMHKQVASRLAQEYDVIYLPKFETSQMARKIKRKIRSKTARAMLTWGHYQFQQTLGHLCNRYGSRMVIVTEEYTSKTCSKCGHIHTKLGGSKKFKCPNCGLEIDRDFNGAFNILLKALWDTTTVASMEDDRAILGLSLDVQRCLG